MMGFGALQPSWSTAEAQHRDSCRTPPLPCWDPHPEPTCAKPPGDCVPPGYGWGWAVCESTAQPRRLLSAIKLCLQGRKPLPFPQSTKSLSIPLTSPSTLHGNCLYPCSMGIACIPPAWTDLLFSPFWRVSVLRGCCWG